jgi:hypothetical protein
VVDGSRTGSYYHNWWHTLQAQYGASVHPIVVICWWIHGQWTIHCRFLYTAISGWKLATCNVREEYRFRPLLKYLQPNKKTELYLYRFKKGGEELKIQVYGIEKHLLSQASFILNGDV